MPPIGKVPEKAPTNNGHVKRPSCLHLTQTQSQSSPGKKDTHEAGISPLVKYLSERMGSSMTGTDHVEIAPPDPDVGDDVVGSTAADAARVIDVIKFLLKGWIPFGMVTGVVAEPGVGKSAFTLWLARTVMIGCDWFNGTQGPTKPSKVLWCGTENDMAITLQRMRSWGIPLDRLVLPFSSPLNTIDLTVPDHLDRIEALVHRHRTLMVVVDSLRGGHDGDENSSRVGKVLQGLSTIAERTTAAVVIVHHTRKLTVDEEVTANSSRGSNAILAMMRSQIGIDKPDQENPWCRVRVLKENLGIRPKPVGFRVTSTGLEFGQAPERPKKEKRETKKDAACQWLLNNMVPGQAYAAKGMIERAEPFGHTAEALKRAREVLKVESKNESAGWMWFLPNPVEG